MGEAALVALRVATVVAIDRHRLQLALGVVVLSCGGAWRSCVQPVEPQAGQRT